MKPKKTRSTQDGDLRSKAEKQIKQGGIDQGVPNDMKNEGHLLHELQVHQIELEMQNEELLRAKHEAEDALARYSDLYEFAPIGLFTIDTFGQILEVNLTGTTLLGEERYILLKERFEQFVVPKDRLSLEHLCQQAFRTGVKQSCELRLITSEGSEIFVRIEGTAASDSQLNERRFRLAVMDITERKRAEERLRTSLAEKEVLLKEIHHRVKNNMQVISSLISVQADATDEPVMRRVLEDLRGRVRTMALVHETIYQSEDMARVDFVEYARGLLRFIWQANVTDAERVRLLLDLQPLLLTVEAALPCGLILHELATNALKHAFCGRNDGAVTVALHTHADGRSCMIVSDNGIGLPADLDWQLSQTLGLQLVNLLTRQLGGTIEVEVRKGEGTEFRITFGRERMEIGTQRASEILELRQDRGRF